MISCFLKVRKIIDNIDNQFSLNSAKIVMWNKMTWACLCVFDKYWQAVRFHYVAWNEMTLEFSVFLTGCQSHCTEGGHRSRGDPASLRHLQVPAPTQPASRGQHVHSFHVSRTHRNRVIRLGHSVVDLLKGKSIVLGFNHKLFI